MNDTGGANQPIPTVSDDDRSGFLRGEARFRVVATVAMLALVAAAALGFLGPSERSTSAESAPGTVKVRHPHLTRPGLDTVVTITLTPRQKSDSVRLRVDALVLATLGLQVVHPAPDSQRTGDGVVEYEFAADGDGPYEVSLTGRVPTKAVPARLTWDLAWLTPEADPVTVSTTTWVLP